MTFNAFIHKFAETKKPERSIYIYTIPHIFLLFLTTDLSPLGISPVLVYRYLQLLKADLSLYKLYTDTGMCLYDPAVLRQI